MWWVLVSAGRGREPEAAPARSREGPGGGQDRTQDGLVCGSDSGGGGRFYLCTPTPSTWAHRGEQPPGAAGLGAGPAGRGSAGPRGSCVAGAGPNATSRQRAGTIPVFTLHPGLAGPPPRPPPLTLPERGQQGPALWDGGTRASAGLVEALGSPRALV